MRGVVVLGATGSIGRTTLEVADELGVAVVGLAAASFSADLFDLWKKHPDSRCVVADPERGEAGIFGDLQPEVGRDAVADLARMSDCLVINGVVGFAGLRATLAALEAGNRLGLANKESFVAGGELVNAMSGNADGMVIPVDSEHSAIFQCLLGESRAMVESLVLTASGGPFRGMSKVDLAGVTPAQALRHPNWEMGRRITIDSATLMNKGMEVIEAHYLFGMPYDQIEVVVHPQSVVHSMVRFRDGALKAHLGDTTMHHPIRYAFTYPDRARGASLRLPDLTLEFEEPDRDAFPALDLAYHVGRSGGTAPAVFNAADEVLVAAFLEERIGFTDIVSGVEATLEACETTDVTSIEGVIDADRQARAFASEVVLGRAGKVG
ncbi:MAG: 1-deoxy-D-xylulose-5-phosphate reductoisomerase [Acidimicrobiia bacterium]|nr:1-deoxy-D-xylulose-5-phosphate reductoisomerase [Acidimicrobiia bacterium]